MLGEFFAVADVIGGRLFSSFVFSFVFFIFSYHFFSFSYHFFSFFLPLRLF